MPPGGGSEHPRLRGQHRLVAGPLARQAVARIVYVRHDSLLSGSPLAPGQPGNGFKAELRSAPDLIVAKHVNSAFLGTPDLDAWLRERELQSVAICGITTNHCCERRRGWPATSATPPPSSWTPPTHSTARTSRAAPYLPMSWPASGGQPPGEFAEVVNTHQLLAD